ncbi:DUF3846 domain-containing protein [Bifidobacterium miconisargentati]|uniref:DUF3846 domain-containing protein n=1 Tax=Bifidobacterium miconisargentati TaxID=2834437 RepID=UPI001BDC36F2|nr:DUF3846 domain-containing protein [Bifidobacterium miconisargentati]MBW3089200.1 DUF3846 domain-containing protein [Bifidobacterium miconisargentati]
MNTITALIIEPGRKPLLATIEDDLETLQSIVGGYLEPLPLASDAVCYVNEEGKLLGLEPNRMLMRNNHAIEVIRGTFLICGRPPGTDRHVSLNDMQAETYKRRFEHPLRAA